MTNKPPTDMQKLFEEWHLATFFVPPEPTLAAHMDRYKGFMGGYQTAKQEGK